MQIAVAYNAGTQTGAQIATAIAAASNGTTVEISPIAGQTVTLSTVAKTGVTVRRVRGSPLLRLTATSCSGLTFSGLSFANPNVALADPDADEATTATLVLASCSDIRVTDCDFDNVAATYDKNLQAIYCGSCTDIEIDTNTFTNIYRAMSCVACGDGTAGNVINFHDNTVTRFVSQGIRIAWSDCYVETNSFTEVLARTGRRLIGTITGTLLVGDSISYSSGATLEGGQIQTVGAGYVDVMYNAHEKPTTTSVDFVKNGAAGNYISVTSITTAYDPVHPDGIQAINNSATRDCLLKINRNRIGRGASSLVSFPTIETDNAFPGIRVQQNTGGTYQWVSAEINQNFIWSDHPEAAVIDGLDAGSVKNNIAVQSTLTATDSPARITISVNSIGTTAQGNASNVTGGIVDNGTGTITGGNVNFAPGDYASQLPSLVRDSPPHAIADFTPAAASALDTNNAGPLDTAGVYQLY